MQNARRAHKIRLCGHLRRYKKIVKKAYIILFKYYVNLPIHIPLKVAIAEDIVKAAPQSIQKLSKEKFEKIVKLSGSDKQIKI